MVIIERRQVFPENILRKGIIDLFGTEMRLFQQLGHFCKDLLVLVGRVDESGGIDGEEETANQKHGEHGQGFA